MAPLDWSDEYLLGIPELDLQHRALFSVVNKLAHATCSEASEDDLLREFRTLLEHTRNHFKAEEELMAQARYPLLEAHSVIHHHLFDDMTRTMFRARDQRESMKTQLLPQMKAWLVDHIVNEDRRMASFLLSSAGEEAASERASAS